ncbi:hypothetical protein EOD42_22375 [Rhodovarius crocodyli]|uniref:Phage tail protein n=1 Tax=Rhodovarius crocodyli TaxID=1979269 RepID=A0A437M1K3_9PROT|nr:hypothetical protein [Rhodovarius crocodyli]RVT91404.1 hypothetical protein EOD42_22375 [Rhodovarius crocodyli]
MTSLALSEPVPGPRGHFRLEVRRRGVLVEVDDHPNIIVNGARTQQARLIGGDVVGRSITQIGFGEGSGAADASNSGLTNAFKKALSGVTYPAWNSVQFAFTLGTGEGNGLSIIEFGLICNNDTLFARRVRTGALVKASDLSFSGTWTITYN